MFSMSRDTLTRVLPLMILETDACSKILYNVLVYNSDYQFRIHLDSDSDSIPGIIKSLIPVPIPVPFGSPDSDYNSSKKN